MALIRLRVCAEWSESLLVAHTLLEISCTGLNSSSSDYFCCHNNQFLVHLNQLKSEHLPFITQGPVLTTDIQSCSKTCQKVFPQFQGNSKFKGKILILLHLNCTVLEQISPFKMHKITFFSRKKMCVPTLP